MPRTWRRRTARGVSGDTLRAASEQVARGDTIRATANRLAICHVTLARYVKIRRRLRREGSDGTPRVGYNTGKKVFTEAQVAEFLEFHGAMHTITQNKKCPQVKRFAYQLAVQYQRERPPSWDRVSMAGADWFGAFIKRNPTLSIRRPAGFDLFNACSLVCL